MTRAEMYFSDDPITIKSLNGGYEDNPVLKGISIDLSAGGFTAIAGPNGAGKSTLLKYLIKELGCPDDTLYLFGSDVNSLKQKEIAKLISFQGQFIPKSDEFTVREAVALGRFAYGDVESSSSLVDEALRMTGIEHLADKLITRISGGEFQLAMLARTICQNTRILALDEPINNLDPRHQLMLLSLLRKLAGEGRTILCVLHDLNAIMQNCTSCILLKDGSVFASGPVSSVLTVENIKAVYGIDCEILQYNSKSIILFR